jgi:hypothetical protein
MISTPCLSCKQLLAVVEGVLALVAVMVSRCSHHWSYDHRGHFQGCYLLYCCHQGCSFVPWFSPSCCSVAMLTLFSFPLHWPCCHVPDHGQRGIDRVGCFSWVVSRFVVRAGGEREGLPGCSPGSSCCSDCNQFHHLLQRGPGDDPKTKLDLRYRQTGC